MKFFEYDNDKDDEFNKQNTTSFIERKIEGYKSQDRTAKSSIPKKMLIHIGLWKLNNQSNYSGYNLYTHIKNGIIMSNITA